MTRRSFEGENLFNKKPEKAFYHAAQEEAEQQGKKAVLLSGFDKKDILLDDGAQKHAQADREQTINDWQTKCVRMCVDSAVVEEWNRIDGEMQEITGAGEDNEAVVNKEMGLLEKELKSVHDISGKKWREANGKEASVRKAFATLFGLLMVFDLEEQWLLYASTAKAAVNKQMKAFGAAWKKALGNDLEQLQLSQEDYDTLQRKLAQFDEHCNSVEGVEIKFAHK